MALESFSWNANFATGLSQVDHEHHQLVDIINKFGELLVQDELVFEDIESVYEELAGYAQRHFKTEEVLMSRFGVDQRHREHHLNQHHGFLEEASLMRATITSETPDAANAVLKFLTDWLAYHILGTDQSMAKQIASIQAGRRRLPRPKAISWPP